MKNIRIEEDLKHRNAKDAPDFNRVWRGWGFLTEIYSKHIPIHSENSHGK